MIMAIRFARVSIRASRGFCFRAVPAFSSKLLPLLKLVGRSKIRAGRRDAFPLRQGFVRRSKSLSIIDRAWLGMPHIVMA